ncbi:MAG: nuclear transport factor 2 family protein [Chitinophagaceae bacterium]
MRIIIAFICLLLMQQAVTAQADKNVTLIKSLRASSNEAIAKHDVKALSSFWLDDVVLVRGNSTHVTGKDTIVSDWQKLFNGNPKVLYIRIPSQITISANDTLAWETGTWKASNSYSNGGNYSAMWKKRNNEWKIQAELFVSLF